MFWSILLYAYLAEFFVEEVDIRYNNQITK